MTQIRIETLSDIAEGFKGTFAIDNAGHDAAAFVSPREILVQGPFRLAPLCPCHDGATPQLGVAESI